MPGYNQHILAAHLSDFLNSEQIIVDRETQRPFECDGLAVFTEMPLLVVLPDSREQVQLIMRLCSKLGVPVVTRGAGTGLSAGATPNKDGILLSLTKLSKILEIDPVSRVARVEPGVRNIAVSEAAAAYGLYYAPDPSSQIACSIGGNVAENAGGVHSLKYGLTLHNILGLEFVTADGEIIRTGSRGLDAPGFDLNALMVGSEGLLGVVTEVSLKLLPIPEVARVVMAGFSSIEQAGNAVSAIIASGTIPAGLEMMDSLAIQAAEDFAHAGYPRDAAALLLCEVDGCKNEVAEQVAAIEALLFELGATTCRTSDDETDRLLIWKGRKSAFPAVGKLSPDYYCMDGTIPRRKIAQVLVEIQRLAKHYGLRVANVFHAGDGNLHPLILFDAEDSNELANAMELGGKILELSVAVGGCITGEHGVGKEKLPYMHKQFSDQELSQFHAIKKAFDPLGILNPDKGIPTLRQCQEYRAIESRVAKNG